MGNGSPEIRVVQGGRRSRWLLAGAAATGIAFLATQLPGCDLIPKVFGQDKKITQPEPADVFTIQPESLNCRALVGTEVSVDASVTPQVLGHDVPFYSSSTRHKVMFRGAGGQNGGVVDTLACYDATASHDEVTYPWKDGNGNPDQSKPMHTIHMPEDSIHFVSWIDESNATTIHDNGNLLALGAFEWGLVPVIGHNVVMNFAKGEAGFEQLVRTKAVDIAQGACGEKAWGLTQKAMTDGERAISSAQYDKYKLANTGKTVSNFDPFSVEVVIDPVNGQTKPNFDGPYDLSKQSGVDYTVVNSKGEKNGQPVCEVRDGAYNPPHYQDAMGADQTTVVNK